MKQKLLISLVLAVLFPAGRFVPAQDEPYPVHDTYPVILNGPYLVAPGQEGVTIVWRTDTPCHSRVLYGKTEALGRVAEPQNHGLLPVGTLHSVRLTGLQPGQTYFYRTMSRRVVRLRGYWPEMGGTRQSELHSFRTLARDQERVSFSFITDTQHENVARLRANLGAVDWSRTQFLVHGGDAFSTVENEEQLFDKWLDPISRYLDHRIPLVFARGNHDMRGPYARSVYDYVATGTGRYYYAFDAGPIHFLVLDTGEDKADERNVYSGLNRFGEYRREELAWLQNHVRSSSRLREAAFRVILMHSPSWGWVGDARDEWTRLANEARIDLVLAGHFHRHLRSNPGEDARDFTVLVTGQDQVTFVEATQETMSVTVQDVEGEELDAFRLKPKAAR